jgi:hypothetical protein
MSMELWVALPVGEEATPAAISAQARHLGFDLGLPGTMVFDEVAGFQRGSLDGEPAGAEMEIFDRYDVADMAEAFGERATTMGRIAAFRWSGSFIEGAFAYVFAAALVAGHDAVCFDTEEGEILPVERIVDIAHSLLAQAHKGSAG